MIDEMLNAEIHDRVMVSAGVMATADDVRAVRVQAYAVDLQNKLLSTHDISPRECVAGSPEDCHVARIVNSFTGKLESMVCNFSYSVSVPLNGSRHVQVEASIELKNGRKYWAACQYTPQEQ